MNLMGMKDFTYIVTNYVKDSYESFYILHISYCMWCSLAPSGHNN